MGKLVQFLFPTPEWSGDFAGDSLTVNHHLGPFFRCFQWFSKSRRSKPIEFKRPGALGVSERSWERARQRWCRRVFSSQKNGWSKNDIHQNVGFWSKDILFEARYFFCKVKSRFENKRSALEVWSLFLQRKEPKIIVLIKHGTWYITWLGIGFHPQQIPQTTRHVFFQDVSVEALKGVVGVVKKCGSSCQAKHINQQHVLRFENRHGNLVFSTRFSLGNGPLLMLQKSQARPPGMYKNPVEIMG